MRVPQIFVPEKRLDYKIEELYEDPKEHLDRKINKFKRSIKDPFYLEISSSLKALLDMLEEDYLKILWISDKHQTSRYGYVEEIVNETIEILEKIEILDKNKTAYEMYNYYDRTFGRKDLITVLDKWCNTRYLLQIVYTNHKTTKKLKRNLSYEPLFHKSSTIFI